MPGNAVVIVAAGRGQRLGQENGPKQYQKLGGISVLQHTINCFVHHTNIDAIQVVIHPDDLDKYEQAIRESDKLLAPVIGGKTRQASCKAGVDAVNIAEFEKVLIHDAARPFVSADTIDRLLDGIASKTSTLPGVAIADTIKRADNTNSVVETVPRDDLFLAQTPQGFFTREIADAHAAAAEIDTEFTDDAAVAEWHGMSVTLVEGNRDNFKITTKQDMLAAQEKVAMVTGVPDVRTGNGYDVHTLGEGNSVILCGVEIPHTKKLQGHSDADVGLHSLTDALLGTIGEGDIGSHFPPSDPKWKGAASYQFLEHAKNLVVAKGGNITSLDVTIVCEAPKIGPHRDAMRARLAEICCVDQSRISVKATTNEKVGFIGREEGIAAFANATVVFPEIRHE